VSTISKRLRSLVWRVQVWVTEKLCEMFFALSVWADKVRKRLSSSLGKEMFSNSSVTELLVDDKGLLISTATSWAHLKGMGLLRAKSRLGDSSKVNSLASPLINVDSCSLDTDSAQTKFTPMDLDMLRCLEGSPFLSEVPTTNFGDICYVHSSHSSRNGTRSKKTPMNRGLRGTTEPTN
jgi:hypothetical protein